MLAQEQQSEEQQQQQQMMMKGKRTKRSRTASPFALTISTSGEDICRVATSSSTTTTANESGVNISNSSQPHPPSPTVTEEEEDMANCLILLAQGVSKTQKLKHEESESPATISAARATAPGMFVYECKTCNRCFPSFQALGGHRASHRKPKLPTTVLSLSEDHRDCFQSLEIGKIRKVEELGLSLQMSCNSSNTLSASNNNHHHHPNESNTNNNNIKSNKVHTCAICGAEFASGQALGGHMRRHRPIAISGGSPATIKSASPPSPAKNVLCLDLNLPADEEEEEQQSPKFIFASKEKTLVFANSLVDCRY